MLTRELNLNQMPAYPFEEEYDLNKIVFFDIETTGLSPQNSYLYLIGCAYYKDDSFHLLQWFSENVSEEEKIIGCFFDFIKDYDVLIHFNGSSFDLPFIQEKLKQLELDYCFDDLISLDIYRMIKPYRQLLRLSNMRQKSIESFLKIKRKDKLDGEELIGIYAGYIGKKRYECLKQSRLQGSIPVEPSESARLLELLLLHNEDDICGLLKISSILYYVGIFNKPIRISTVKTEKDSLIVSFKLSSRLPVAIRLGDGPVAVYTDGDEAHMTVQIYEGELKHFYDNYRDYYYLPEEDCAVHKAVAAFVDKNYRVKAKPSNCYTKKSGLFAPQYEKVISPCFMQGHQDKLSFVEVHTDSLLREDNLELYIRHLLNHLQNSIKK